MTKRRSPKRGRKQRRRERWEAAQAALPWYHRGPSDQEIVDTMDDPEELRLTVTVSLVVRVTRAEVLQRYASETFQVRRDVIDLEGFTPGAYESLRMEGLDAITAGPSGQLRYLAEPDAVVAGIPGVAVENAAMTIDTTPEWLVQQLREDRGFTNGYLYDTGLVDIEPPDNTALRS